MEKLSETRVQYPKTGIINGKFKVTKKFKHEVDYFVGICRDPNGVEVIVKIASIYSESRYNQLAKEWAINELLEPDAPFIVKATSYQAMNDHDTPF